MGNLPVMHHKKSFLAIISSLIFLLIFIGGAQFGYAAGSAIGYLDNVQLNAVTNRYQVNGWSCVPGQLASVSVALYAGNPASGGVQIGTYAANQSSESLVGTACGTNGKAYRYAISLAPDTVQKYTGKPVYVFGLSVGAPDAVLVNSGTYGIPSYINAKGYLNNLRINTTTNRYEATGWACIPGQLASINVDVYVGDPKSGGVRVASMLTNNFSEKEIALACGTNGTSYRYAILIDPAVIRTYLGQPLYAVGVTPGGAGDMTLVGSGTFKLPVAYKNATGHLDNPSLFQNKYMAGGWACIPGQPGSINVDLYVGDPQNGGVKITGGLANQSSEAAVGQACGTTGSAYRFSLTLSPTMIQKYTGQLLYAVGVTPGGVGDVALNGSGTYKVPSYIRAAGHLDGIKLSNSKYVAGGWACIPTQKLPITIALYAGDPAAGGSFIGTYAANQFSTAAVGAICQTSSTSYRYSIPLSASTLQKYTGRPLYAVALTPGGAGDVNLVGSGSFTIPSPYTTVKGRVGGIALEAGQYVVNGWACIPGQTAPINVAVYAGAPGSGGVKMMMAAAGNSGEAGIATVCGEGGSTHRFSIALDATNLLQFGGQPVYVVGLTPAGTGDTVLEASRNFYIPAKGRLERTTRNYIRGWACPDTATNAPKQVFAFATNVPGCASPVTFGGVSLCRVPTDPGTGIKFNTNPATANLPREAVIANMCGTGAKPGFQILMPSALLDGIDHKIYAFIVNHPDDQNMLAGSPVKFNSNTLYQQEPVIDLTWNTQIDYEPIIDGNGNVVAPLSPDLKKGLSFINPADNYDNMNMDRTTSVYWGMPANPLGAGAVPTNLSGELSNFTGLNVSSDNQLGFIDSVGRVNALQSYGTTLGFSEAFRGITPEAFVMTTVTGYPWLQSKASRPFAGNKGIKVNGYIQRPYVSVPQNPANTAELIGVNGLEQYYYTLVFKDLNHCTVTSTGTQCPTLWYAANLYQNQLSSPKDSPAAGDGTQDTISGNAANVYPTSLLRQDSAWLTPCSGSGGFYAGLGGGPGETQYCFSMSAVQFQKVLLQANAKLNLSYSTDPADYTLFLFVMDMEHWLPRKQNDPRMGMSFRDISITSVP